MKDISLTELNISSTSIHCSNDWKRRDEFIDSYLICKFDRFRWTFDNKMLEDSNANRSIKQFP